MSPDDFNSNLNNFFRITNSDDVQEHSSMNEFCSKSDAVCPRASKHILNNLIWEYSLFPRGIWRIS